MTDTRPLNVRVRALARRYDAIAIGSRKSAARSQQDATNAEADAKTLHEAADELDRQWPK